VAALPPVALRAVTSIVVRTISAADHLDFVRARRSASFLQTPGWGEVKNDWQQESLGWYDGDAIVGVGLVLYRQIPLLKRYLAYLPEGPVLDWDRPDLHSLLQALATYARRKGAFAVRMGPQVPLRSWSAETIKKAIADSGSRRLSDVPADERMATGHLVAEALRSTRWRPLASAVGFSSGQPQFVFQIPLSGRTPDDVLSGMNQLWRRNIKKADKLGVVVTQGAAGDIPAFHQLYVETARRDSFTPRPLGYFQQMFTALLAEDPDRIRLYLAHHEGDLVAAATWVKVGRHTWYSYGASSTTKREVRGSNAIQWRMICDSIEAGADVYDLRGITETLDSDDPHIGLIQFKVGTGGRAVEYVGEWDLPLNRLLYTGFQAYMSRR